MEMKNQVASRELHGFGDASKKEYVACVYVRSVIESENIQVRFLTSTSGILPFEEVAMSKLEPLKTLLVTRLIRAVKTALEKEIKFEKVIYRILYLEISLTWTKATDKKFTAFVKNRLKEILRNSDVNKWHYIETKQNPAGPITRMLNLIDVSKYSNLDKAKRIIVLYGYEQYVLTNITPSNFCLSM